MHVLISGGGIAGLTLAYRLHGAGIECTIVEKSPSPRTEGYMIDFFGSGYDAAQRMGLLADLERIHYPIVRLSFLDREGREKFSVPYTAFRQLFDGRHFNFLRGDLERILYAKVQRRVEMRFATTIRSFEQNARSVRAVLSDDSTVTADLLVGADGVHSHIRELAFGEEARFSRFLNCSTAAFIIRNPPPALRGSDALRTLTVPGRQVAIYPVRDGGVATFFVHTSASQPANASPTTAAQELHGVYGGMGWIIPELLKHMDPAELYFDRVLQIETPRWSTRRAVLIGDACYCVSLLAGQGASLAMAGAYILSEELSSARAELTKALTRYEQRLRPAIEKKQRAGRKMANWFVPKDSAHLIIRDAVTRLAGFPGAHFLLRRFLASDSGFISSRG